MQTLWVEQDISKAQTLSKEFYLDQQYYDSSRDKIFSRTWQWLTNGHPLDTSDKCFPVTLLEGFMDEPLLLTVDKNGIHHCVSNVCTHRGALLVQQACTLSNIRCPYHGRMFELDGTFKSMPEFKEVQNFPSADDHLVQSPLFQFGGSSYTCLAGNLPAEDFFGPMLARLSWLPLHEFIWHPQLSKDYYVKAHWALYCENYLEGFHIPFVHPALNQALDFGSYRTELYTYSSLQLGIAKEGEECFDLPVSSPDYGQRIAAYYYFVFPNLMFNFYPWGLSLNVVQPAGKALTKVSFHTLVWQANKLHKGAGADVDTTELEDEAVVESVQKGIRSRSYKYGRYSVKHETGTHHFHRLIADFMNQ